MMMFLLNTYPTIEYIKKVEVYLKYLYSYDLNTNDN